MTISLEQADSLAQNLYSEFFASTERIPVRSIQNEYETELETLLDSDEPLDIDSYCAFEQLVQEYKLVEQIQNINAWHSPNSRNFSYDV